MRIRELTLENYRVFAQPHTFHFGDHFTIIAGVNGRGKTGILDGLATLLSRLLPQVSPSQSGFRKISLSDVHHGSEEAKLVVRVLCVDNTPIEFKLRFDRERKRQRSTQLTSKVREHVKAVYGDPKRSDDQAPLAVYYTTDRAGYRIPKKLPSDVPKGQAAAYAGALSSRLVDYKEFMARYRLWSQLGDGGADESTAIVSKRAIKAFNTALEIFLDGFSDVEILEEPLSLTVKKDGCKLAIGQLSDGERSFFAMICDLVRRLALANPLLDDPLQGAGVVLIDELELHLHPKWQREVVENLRATFPNIQFITTTHSPFILQTAREGEIIKLDGDLVVEPAGRTIEEVARLVMDVTNMKRSPRYQQMLDTAHSYLALVEEAKTAENSHREQIQAELIKMLEPFTDNPAYTALLERKGLKGRED